MLPLLQCINFKYDTPTSNAILFLMNTPDVPQCALFTLGVTEKIDLMAFDRPMPLARRALITDLQKGLHHLGSFQARDERGATLLLDQHSRPRGELLLVSVHPPLDGIPNVCACAPYVMQSCIQF